MDRYVRIKKIGEGSFGKALLVRNKENGKQMVVKEINMNRMQRKEREEARKEVAVLAQLAHPNVVAYRESFEETGNLYIVMDYCDGGDLYGKINAQRGILFPEDQILDWFVQTCLAIKHIHDRKILHRDVKSQNIFLTKHGIIKLGDFGISKVLNSTVELARTCIGTPYYLSPEICENKPYNNKSDVWSLGCVLYELCTLKHAFEAGNMKNLVLKIIRGSYPPPPPRYSYELRSLIALLFKRSPRDRPSINTVLRKSILQSRIKRFLSESELAEEFSHTVMHGVKIKKALPQGGPRPLPPKPVVAKRVPSPAGPMKYDPAAIYAPSVARKSRENNRQSAEGVRKSAAGGVRRPPSGGAKPSVVNQDMAKKRQDLIDKEKKRREEAKKKDQYAKAHKDLVEKQRLDRINKAREEGWRNVMSDTLSSEDSEKKDDVARPLPSPKLAVPAANIQRERGNFDHHHEWLNKLEADRKANNQQAPVRPIGGQVIFDPYQAAKEGNRAGAKGRAAADKARVHEEFHLRQREAALNKARGQGAIAGLGVAAAISPRVNVPSPSPSPVSRPNSARSDRDAKEQEYLARLRQIRLQNFNERKGIKEKNQQKADPKFKPPVDPKNDPQLRKKKIEALRAQADERAKKLKEDLEKKRKEIYDLEQKRLKDKLIGKPAKASEKPVAAGPVKPPIPMTEAMKAIGAVKEPEVPVVPPEPCPIGMTAAMQAIGATPSTAADSKDEPKSQIQKKKQEILKRLNAKASFTKESDDSNAAAPSDRPKWGEPVKPCAAQEYDRPKWGAAGDVGSLAQKTLEVTSSQMEATSAGDVAEKPSSEEPNSGRKHWASPHGTVLNVLQQAKLLETSDSEPSTPATPSLPGTTITIAKDQPKPDAEAATPTSSSSSLEGLAPSIGSTFTVAHSAAKGNVVIKRADQPPTAVSIIAEEVEPSDAKGQSEEEAQEETKDDNKLEPSVEKKESPRTRRRNQSRSRSHSPKVKPSAPALFDKVELDETEEHTAVEKDDLDLEDVEETPRSENLSKSLENLSKSVKTEEKEEKKKFKESGLVLGLTTGNFDIDVKMLRTCSEPDLSKLFKTAVDPDLESKSNEAINKSVNVALGEELDEEDEDDDESGELYSTADLSAALEAQLQASCDAEEAELEVTEGPELEDDSEEKETKSEVKDDSEKEGEEEEDEGKEEGSSDEVVSDEEDELETLRESMMSILQNDDGDEALSPLATKKKKVVKKSKNGKKIKKKKNRESFDEDGSQRPLDRKWSKASVEDLKTMRETMKSVLKESNNSSLQKVCEVSSGDNGSKASGAVESPNIVPGRESWQDDDDEGDDDYFEEEDMFSRLEASRAKLEEELGCDTFLKAYKTVQAIHEDEDENMEEGVEHVTKILGHNKLHLYPTILQLVMADGVFTEDNE